MVADQRVTTLVVSCRGNIPTAQVLIQIRVLHEIPSGTLQRFVVRAPGELSGAVVFYENDWWVGWNQQQIGI